MSDLRFVKIHPSVSGEEWDNSGNGSEGRRVSGRLVQRAREEVPVVWTVGAGVDQQVGGQTDGAPWQAGNR